MLKPVVREDVTRLREWLTHEEVSESWFGRYSYGDPAHLGYHPDEMETANEHDWEHVFNNPEHRILSVYTGEDEHIGEVHLAIEESLGDGQLSILIGRSDLWHRGYGTAALHAALETTNLRQTATVCDIGRFGRPGGDGPETGGHIKALPITWKTILIQ